MPKGYVIVNLDVHDPEMFEKYRELVPPTIARYDGKYLVRGGAMEVLEGNVPLPRSVVLEFPSLEQARTWYSSPEYQAIIGLRHGASTGNCIVVEGL